MPKEPIYKIEDPITEALNKIQKIIWAVISVLVLGFMTLLLMVVGLVIDAWRYRSNSYEATIETIRKQEQILETLQKQQKKLNENLKNLEIINNNQIQNKKP